MENQWKDKHISFLGDSITEGVAVTKETAYWSVLEKEVGIIPHCFGVNGARFCDLYEQAVRMKEEAGDVTDAVFIFAGTNDYFGGTPIGEFFSYSEEPVVVCRNEDGTPCEIHQRKKRSFIYDNSFCGSINKVLSFLKENFHDRQIVIMTPIHRAYACFGTENIQYNELYSNSQGLFLEDYSEMLKTASEIWATELINLHNCSGMFPLYDSGAAKYFSNIETDRIHPNATGHRRLAQIIENKLRNIPVFER